MSIKITKTIQSKLPTIDFDKLTFGTTMSDHMLIAKYKNNQWGAAEIIPYGPLSFSPALMALHYGQAVFEGMKAYKNDKNEAFLFRIDANFVRLNESAKRLSMPELPRELFIDGLKTLVHLEKDWIPTKAGSALYLRPFIFASEEIIKASPATEYLFIIICSPVNAYYTAPLSVKIEQKFSRAADGGTGYSKAAGNYAGSFYPAHLAQQEGYDQILWTDAASHQYIEESGTMNIMIAYDGKIVTPPIKDTILNGVTRRSILQVAKDLGYEAEERPISVSEVIEGLENGRIKEVFGCGTAVIIINYKRIGYQGKDYDLASLPEEHSIASQLRTHLINIQMGLSADKHQWVTVI